MENDNEQDAMKKGCTEEAVPNPPSLISTLVSTIMPKGPAAPEMTIGRKQG